MGCPKHFSIQGGMGAALLKKPEMVKDIMTTLTRNFNRNELPITCKIRLLENQKDTETLVKLIENCGVQAIGVHGRYTPDRPRHPARIELIKAVVNAVKIPIIYNGDVFRYEHFAEAKN
eukprot:UN34250